MSMFGRIFIKKTIVQIQKEAAAGELKRTLGKWNLVSLGIGCIIGAGIFVMTGTAAANHAGPAIVLSFVFTGIACAFVGLCYAELASLLPVSGSAYTYAYATLGEVFAWVMGWLLLLEYGVAAATVAVGWSGYINSFLLGFGVMIPPELTTATGNAVVVSEAFRGLYEAAGYAMNATGNLMDSGGAIVKGVFNLPAFIGIGMVTTLLVIGVSESAKINNIIVAIKLIVVIMFVAIGAFYVDPANWHPFIPEKTAPGVYGWDGVFRAASIIFFAYVGFEAVSTAAQEAKNPQKDMPFGILGSLLICTLLYMGVAAVLTGVVKYPLLNVADPMAVAVDAIGLGWFAFLIKIGAITGLTSVMLVLLYGQTRIFYTMAHDGLLPPSLSKIHPKFKTPYINTIIVGVLVAIAAGVTPISLLGDLVSLGTLLAFIIVCFTVLYLRKVEPHMPRPFRTPGMPVTPVLGILTCGYLVFSIFFGTDEAGAIVLTESGSKVLSYTGPYVVVGALIYAFYGARNSVLHKDSKRLHATIKTELTPPETMKKTAKPKPKKK
jgi:APA family basic amino acid/polyamine antiporter